MSLSSLQVLVDNDNRNALLLAEVAAWLHDIGKSCDSHVKHVSGQKTWSNDDAYKVVVDHPNALIQLSQGAANIKKPDVLNNVLSAQSPKAADFIPKSIKDFLQDTRVHILGQNYALAELIMLGMPGFATHAQRNQLLDRKDGWLPAVLGLCHNVAHVDKEDPIGGAQSLPNVLTSNAFGYEEQKFVLGDPQRGLDAKLVQLKINTTALADSRKDILEAFQYGLGDTRRPTNEVTLADWSATVAALFKTALAGAILTNTQPQIRQWKSWKDKIIDHDFHWRLLRVNFDVLGLYAKAVRIADLLGYQRAVSEACEAVKKLVEEEYPLGNEVYRDTTGIYFTFPDLDLPADLEQEIRRRVEEVEPELAPRIAVTVGDGATATEQLKGILAKARGEAVESLAQPFDEHNLSPAWHQKWEDAQREPGQWEVCPVCRLRPKREGADVCEHCENRRASRLEAWKQDPAHTIWVGEIADHNDRLALLVGKFGLDDWLSGDLVQTMLVKADPNHNIFTPKNPSPARLRRVWETCQRFWDETVVKHSLTNTLGCLGERIHILPDKTNWTPGLYNGKVNGKPLDLFWQPKEKAFLTVSNLQAAGAIKPGDTVTLEQPDTKQKAEFQVQSIREAPAPFDHYQAYLTLHTSPDQFLALVPAAKALKIVNKIYMEYERQFGKVRNRLPLFLGLIFCERKMPLQAVMDAARSMLNMPVKEEQWKINAVDGNGHIQFENSIAWNIPTVMGDGQTEDLWYPYFALENPPAAPRTRQFQHGGKTWVHVKDLKQGDAVAVTPSRFDFLWLDAAARRFEAAYDAQGRRPARPTRPFYLEDLDRLENLWGRFSQLSRTQQKQVLQTIETTRERWFGRDNGLQSAANPTFKQFVTNTLANAEWDWKAISENQRKALTAVAVRGDLADLAELHLEILKENKE
ncbi:MAG: CRISPR-associated protein Csx11 [Anaerolineae bacterium]|nr:MAG: CRISPR-associated protein Csx11 [Anaerolineae bacterium]